METLDFDVVVVGCGIAGLSAAVSALEQGARVAILERAPEEERGGQTRWTEAMMRMKSLDAVSDDVEEHLARNAGYYLDPGLVQEAAGSWESWSSIVKVLGFTDPELISTLADRAGPTIRWLEKLGVRFDFLPGYFITTCTTRMAPVGGGHALVEALAAAAEKLGGRIHYRTTARELLREPDGSVAGTAATGPGGKAIRFGAPSIVLGSGGFEGNPEMLTRYLGPRARYLRPVARGGYYNKGEGIRMALEIGAAPCGDFGQIHAEPLDPRSGATEPIVLVFSYGVLVNRDGRRFVDEAPATVDATYEAITRTVLRQPEGIAYVILDSRIEEVPNWKRSVRSDQPPIVADSLEALAAKLGIDGRRLERTIAEYNAACVPGRFDPLAADGLKTAPDLDPPKSNWARPIERAPFLAYPVICGNCFTFGGIKVNTRSQVLDMAGDPIAGLYAAGEMTGLYYGTYTGATSVLRGAVFGRIAGAEAARRARELPSA